MKEEILQNFIYDQNPFKNFLPLIDLENYEFEDNVRTEKQIEKVKVVDRLQILGFEPPATKPRSRRKRSGRTSRKKW